MRFLVLGTGSIGQRHCRNLVALGHEVLAWDVDSARLRESVSGLDAKAVGSLEQGLAAKPAGALVCTPPSSHLRLAREALAAGADVFVEKPISHASDRVEAFLAAAGRLGRVVMVGFNLRCLESLRQVKRYLDEQRVGKVLSVRAECGSYLPDWRPGRDYRESYAVRAELGGGILLDAIHEIDYLGWLFGAAAKVFCESEHESDPGRGAAHRLTRAQGTVPAV